MTFLRCTFRCLRSTGPHKWQKLQFAPALQSKPRPKKSQGLHTPRLCPTDPTEGQAGEQHLAGSSTKASKRCTTKEGGFGACVGSEAANRSAMAVCLRNGVNNDEGMSSAGSAVLQVSEPKLDTLPELSLDTVLIHLSRLRGFMGASRANVPPDNAVATNAECRAATNHIGGGSSPGGGRNAGSPAGVGSPRGGISPSAGEPGIGAESSSKFGGRERIFGAGT
mmetsp:Transcript_14594/g.37773  ORF Transcript_14594/g.37773 Transcript_14594/m.37773 type:complete len:223 (-) Transcript_14594:114-782(-)